MKKGKEIRIGNVLRIKNEIFSVLKTEHFKPSEKKCIMKLKLQNVITGQMLMTDKIAAADSVDVIKLEEKEMQFLFRSGDLYTFMDTSDYEQLELEGNIIGDGVAFLQEEMIIKVKFYEGRPVVVELPQQVVVTIEYTENVERGNTTGNLIKDAKLANGSIIKVPDFVKTGEKVKIDTTTGAYLSREK